MTRHDSFLFSAAFSTSIKPMLRLNLPELKLRSVLEEESVEVDIVDQCKEFILYNKELMDESESKLIQKERDLLTSEDLIRKDVVNINCLNERR